MKKALLLVFVFSLFHIKVSAETVQWADSLVGYSSQARVKSGSKKQFSAYQALGKPSIMPDFGISPTAWMPDMSRKSIEWIKVAFSNPIFAEQIAIAESMNPGAISNIYLYDENNQEYQVFNNLSPTMIPGNGRMFNLFVPRTNYKVQSLKIELSTKDYYDDYQVDAIAISSSSDTIKHIINLSDDFSEKYEKENLGKAINSQAHELGPVISGDGRVLYFTRDRHPENIGAFKNQDVWVSYLDENGNFSLAENIGAPINNDRNNFVIATSQNGNIIYIGNVYNPDGSLSRGISNSHKTDSGWSFPVQMYIDNYYNLGPHSSYAIGSNGKVMIMAIERSDSYGQSDLYVSLLSDDGNWSEPINLGADINTAAKEESPFLAADGVTLYYSTAGKPGYGSNDMFVTRRLDSTWQKWSEPINLGPNINTRGWDGYYTITASGDWAYFVSNENSIGEEDIFRIKLPKALKPKEVMLVKGRVLNSNSKKPIEAQILYETLEDGKNVGIARSNPINGEYAITLPVGHKYGFMAQADGFASINENIDLTNLDTFTVFSKDLLLVPIQSGETIRLNNIFFDFGKYDLLPESFIELSRIVKLLEKHSDISIIIEGHTDNIGSRQANRILSINRAKSVYDYLLGKGVGADRLHYVGFGSDKPIADNISEEGRQKNRRVEFTIK